MTDLFAYPGTKFLSYTPRTDSSLRKITENLLKFTREYGDILVCQYPLGQTLKNHPWGGVPLLNGIAQSLLEASLTITNKPCLCLNANTGPFEHAQPACVLAK